MNLYEIEAAILDCVDEDGEVVDIEKLNALEMERDSKISNIGCWIKDLRAEAEALKREKQALEARQKAAENKAASLKEYLMGFLNGAKYKDSRISISYRKSTAVDFVEGMDFNTLPDGCKKITVEPSKTAIKELILDGVEVPGCMLVEHNNLQIK